MKNRRSAFSGILSASLPLMIGVVALCVTLPVHGQSRILDLGEVGPEDFAAVPPTSETVNKQLLLPPIPVTDLSTLSSEPEASLFDFESDPEELYSELFIPPEIDDTEIQVASSESNIEDQSVIEPSLMEEVADVETQAIAEIAGEYHDVAAEQELISAEESTVQQVAYAEMPIIATHKVLGVAHRCTNALHAPTERNWIFWRKECQPRSPGPMRCRLQSCFVNWRLSSTYLQGCIPEGYSLQHFIESSPNVEFHASTLAEGGVIDQGGSLENAQKIEGEETKPIQQLSIDIKPPAGELPADRAEEKFVQLPMQLQLPGTHRLWCGTSFYWDASLLNHQPLYFEDVNLERHGFSRGCVMQPLVSGAKFFTTLPALPYLMAANPPNGTTFTLGQSRPGSHACYVCERPRLRLDAATVEAATVIGLVFLIP